MHDPTDMPNWRRLDEWTTTSGQPSEKQLAELKRIGVTTVINLGPHTHEKALPDEAGIVAALGLEYIYIPVDFQHPKESDFADFCATMDANLGHAVHVHCIVNARVSAFMYRYQRDMLGIDEGQARAAMNTLWQPGGAWAEFIGDRARISSPHAGPVEK